MGGQRLVLLFPQSRETDRVDGVPAMRRVGGGPSFFSALTHFVNGVSANPNASAIPKSARCSVLGHDKGPAD